MVHGWSKQDIGHEKKVEMVIKIYILEGKQSSGFGFVHRGSLVNATFDFGEK